MTIRTCRGLAPALLIAALASCGANDRARDTPSNGGSTVENATLAKISLTSEAFADGQPIPVQYTCDGADQPPPLSWGEPPSGTKSFALVVDDPDAPSGIFRHWGAYNIPASARSLQAGSFAEAVNDFGKPGYGGPCPPKGHGPHHYRLKLFALGVDRLDLANPKIRDMETEAEKHVIGRADLTGTYERK
jgi:Raf kinase inhibitor-like YbhB/YbcL family protein